MRWPSQAGTRPWCSGRSALPARRGIGTPLERRVNELLSSQDIGRQRRINQGRAYMAKQIAGHDPGRTGRLDLRTLARHVLSRGSGPEAGTGIRQPKAECDRDQRHLPHTQRPEILREVARRDARRFHLRAQGPRFITNRRELAERRRGDRALLRQRVLALKDKLGPINWQLAPTKQLDLDDIEAFLRLLPRTLDGRTIRHASRCATKASARPSSSHSRASTAWPSCSPAIRSTR